jgi:hypothetical protein
MIGIGRTSEGDGHTRAARVPYMVHSRPRPCPAKPRMVLSYDTPPHNLLRVVLSRLRAKVPKKASDPFSYAIFGTFTLSHDNTNYVVRQA